VIVAIVFLFLPAEHNNPYQDIIPKEAEAETKRYIRGLVRKQVRLFSMPMSSSRVERQRAGTKCQEAYGYSPESRSDLHKDRILI
jgi:hypothetical protein